jgi:AcrR family transcriptional regulator
LVQALKQAISRGETTPPPTLATRRKYASPLMHDRKQRILSEAQSLLDEHGVDGFTIRELSRRAGVAQRTLYNVFGSKEDIVSSAIEQHFAGLLTELPAPPPADDIEAHLRRIEAISRRTIGLRRYATAMVGVFFSPTVDRRIYDSLRHISLSGSGDWVKRAENDKVLLKLSPQDRDRLTMLLMNVNYANVTDWAAGRISDLELTLRAQVNFLLCIRAFLRPKYRPRVDDLLERLKAARVEADAPQPAAAASGEGEARPVRRRKT